MDAKNEATEPRRTSLARVVDVASKGVVGLSLASYVIGFIVATTHFARLGVAPHAVSHDTYFAAGLSFLVVTSAAAMFGHKLRVLCVSLFRERRWRFAASDMMETVGLGIMLFGLYGRLQWPGLSLCFLVAVYFAFGPRDLEFSLDRGRLCESAWSAGRFGVPALGLLGYFSLYVYPCVPRQLGGARPVRVATIGVDQSRASSDDGLLMQARCERSPFRLQPYRFVCRRVYLGYESERHVYVIVEEQPGTCMRRDPDPGPDLTAAGTCFIRLPQSVMGRIELPR